MYPKIYDGPLIALISLAIETLEQSRQRILVDMLTGLLGPSYDDPSNGTLEERIVLQHQIGYHAHPLIAKVVVARHHLEDTVELVHLDHEVVVRIEHPVKQQETFMHFLRLQRAQKVNDITK
jgi:hypothetical protein